MRVYTIGHSNRSIEEFLEILKKYRIKMIIDVRRFPFSKKFPWFNKEKLKKYLEKENIEYLHFEKLGGFRKEGYRNFIKTEEFRNALEELKSLIKESSAIMCSEKFWFRCHRRFIAKELSKNGYKVIHVIDKNKAYKQKL
ncbi:MAG: DUF488 domain-containing protein [Candidatus Aenigmatarchaeota archaeon]